MECRGSFRVVLPTLLCAVLVTACASQGQSPPAHGTGGRAQGGSAGQRAGQPAWVGRLPAETGQVIRTISTSRWCSRVFCTLTQAWQKEGDGSWAKVREFRSSIGPKGWGKQRRDDGRTPDGIYGIKVTFSTSPENPGEMPWRRRLPTSTVTDDDGRLYNTWIEENGRTDGDRPSMRWGFVVDYNNVRLRPDVGPTPVQRMGSGIFYHTFRRHHRWEPTDGCTRLSPAAMHWVLTWLRPEAHPRVVHNM